MAALTTPAPGGASVPRRRRWGRPGHRRPPTRSAVVAAAVLVTIAVAAVVGPWFVADDARTVRLTEKLEPPALFGGDWSAPLGTDGLGRDVLARLLMGARVSLEVGLGTVVLAGVVGTGLGVLAGRHRRWGDAVLMRIVDAELSFPGLLIVLAVIGLVGPSKLAIILVLSLVGWMVYTKLARNMVLSLQETTYVEAAETVGCSPRRIVFRHLLPGLMPAVLTVATLEFANAVLAESALSYVGFGIEPPAVSWGLMVAEGQAYASSAWWLVVFPGLGLAATVFALHVLANWMSTRLHPEPAPALVEPPDAEGRAGASEPAPASSPEDESAPLLAIDGLRVVFHTPEGPTPAVQDVSLTVRAGEAVGVVGESGSGKSVTAMALLDLVPPPGRREAGTIRWHGTALAPRDLEGLRGKRIAMVFQDPVAALDPLMTVGRQIAEVLREHRGLSRRAAAERAVELLALTGIPAPSDRARQYPYEFSGGMAQRVVVAMAIAAEPELLIADEPTSSLDVTTQAQILELLDGLRERLGLAVLLISHDLGVVAASCSTVVVMYAGRVMEEGPVDEVLRRPRHPYTRRLIACSPRLDGPRFQFDGSPSAKPDGASGVAAGCPFQPQCDRAIDRCAVELPPMVAVGARSAACWSPDG